MHEVPVLESTREERPRRSELLQALAVVAEADDQRAGLDPAERLEQEVDALVVEQLSEVEDGRLLRGEERLEPLRVTLVGKPLGEVPRVRRGWARPRAAVAQRLAERPGGGHVHDTA